MVIINMKKESLIKAKEIIIKGLSNSKINNEDKAELMINLFTLLNDYENSIKILMKKQNNK